MLNLISMENKSILNLLTSFSIKRVLLALLVFCLGALAVISARFILVEKTATHYHANFALYINGQKEEFNSFVFYEEVSACTDEYSNNPKSRVHMHDKINNLVHVHDNASTWAHFFNNLGITFTDGLILKSGALIRESESLNFTYILNGKEVDSIADKVIASGDALLINIGNESSEVISERFNLISKNANEYNEKPDPSSCSGSANESFTDKFKRTLLK